MLSVTFVIVLISVMMLSVIMLSVVILSVIILSVAAPNAGLHDKTFQSTLQSKGRLQSYLQI
jgi:Tfp pilus assembly protein PilV